MAVATETRRMVAEKAQKNLEQGKREAEKKKEEQATVEHAMEPSAKRGTVWSFEECSKSAMAHIKDLATTLATPVSAHVQSVVALVKSNLETVGAPAYAVINLARTIRAEVVDMRDSGKVTSAVALAGHARARWGEAIPGLKVEKSFKATKKAPQRTETRYPETLTEVIEAILQVGGIEAESSVVRSYDLALRNGADVYMGMHHGLKLPQSVGGGGKGSAVDPSPRVLIHGIGDQFKLRADGGSKHFEAFVKAMGGWDAAVAFCENLIEWAESARPEDSKGGVELRRVG